MSKTSVTSTGTNPLAQSTHCCDELKSKGKVSFKFTTTAVDIITDMISGCTFLNGGFSAILFYIAQLNITSGRIGKPWDLETNIPRNKLWGFMTLSLVWFPG